jgi:hypothetical protein
MDTHTKGECWHRNAVALVSIAERGWGTGSVDEDSDEDEGHTSSTGECLRGSFAASEHGWCLQLTRSQRTAKFIPRHEPNSAQHGNDAITDSRDQSTFASSVDYGFPGTARARPKCYIVPHRPKGISRNIYNHT